MIWKMGLVLISFLGWLNTVRAQDFSKKDTLKFDIDLDQKIDTIIFDRTKSVIVCKLSSQKYNICQSLALAAEEPQAGIRKKGKGFTYYVPQMRSGYHCDFIYNKVAKKIQLKAIDRYEFGPANNDGSGYSKLNLLTNYYEGNWNYYDEKGEKLTKLPVIKRQMTLPRTYLQNFNDEIAYRYIEMCAALYNKTKQNRRSTN